MKLFTTLVLPLIIFALALSVPTNEAGATEPDEFVAWAIKQGQSCDREWSRIVGATSSRRDLASPSCRVRTGRGSSTPVRTIQTAVHRAEWTHTTTSFSHRGDLPFLPLSTRNRNGPSRGTGVLRNPAQAQLGISHEYRRPLNSWVQRKRSFGQRSDFTRPRLTSYGRISTQSGRRGAATRPAYRPDRPKRFRR